jgi:hypothetical protein
VREFRRPRPTLKLGLGARLIRRPVWTAASFGINYLFEQRSLRLFRTYGTRRDGARRIPHFSEQPRKVCTQ